MEVVIKRETRRHEEEEDPRKSVGEEKHIVKELSMVI